MTITEKDIRLAIINAIAYGHTTEDQLAKAVADKLRSLGVPIEDQPKPAEMKPEKGKK